MSTATKNARTFQASATNTAAGTTTGTAVNLTTALGCSITGKITNGATGPTVACDFVVEVSNDNSTFHEAFRAPAGVANNGVYHFPPVVLSADIMYARTKFTGNTAQNVTVEAQGHETTSVS